MSMDKYKVVVKVVELGSLTKVADCLGYTQAGISYILNNIENEFNVKIFNRTRNGVSLNSLGEEIFPYIKAVLEAESQLQSKIQSINNFSSGIIHIGLSKSIASSVIPAFLPTFKNTFPEIKIVLHEGTFPEIEKMIVNDEVDLGFVIAPTATPLITYPFIKDEIFLAMPHNHEFSKLKSVSYEQLLTTDLINYGEDPDNEVLRFLPGSNTEPHYSYSIDDDFAIFSMVEQGLGTNLTTKLITWRTPFDICMKSLNPPLYRELVIALKSHDKVSPSVQLFIDSILSNLDVLKEKLEL